MKSWAKGVRDAAPRFGSEGIPVMPHAELAIPGFEDLLPGGYFNVDLAKFNWNHRNSGVQRQGIFGWNSKAELPTLRIAAADLAAQLIKADENSKKGARLGKVSKLVENILHPQLRAVLNRAKDNEKPGHACAEALTEWLRRTIKNSLPHAKFSNHPADKSRQQLLAKFSQGNTESIPVTIGIKMLRPSDNRAVNLSRVDKHGNVIHRYRADPGLVAKIVGYRKTNDGIDRSKPLIFDWRQSWALVPKRRKLPAMPEGVLNGRAYGQTMPDSKQWFEALKSYFREIGVAECVIVKQGNVVQYDDGGSCYIRNFSSTQGFKPGMLKGIIGVRRTPFVDNITPNTVVVN
jgi:hypothetical protein